VRTRLTGCDAVVPKSAPENRHWRAAYAPVKGAAGLATTPSMLRTNAAKAEQRGGR
jgi:hypothetical protein